MSDPLASAVADQPSPFAFSLNTVNSALDILRYSRDNIRGREGGADPGLDKLPPTVRIWIRNDTGTDLTVGSIVAIGDPLITITDTDAVHEFRDGPVFKGTTPAATTDAFAILDEPIAATTGSGSGTVYSYGRALILGVTSCEVNMTTTFPTHNYATPTAATTARLTSGTGGPVRILYVEAGTGNKTAAVQVMGVIPFSPTDTVAALNADYTMTASSPAYQDTGLSISVSTPGLYRFDCKAQLMMQHTATGATMSAALFVTNNSGGSIPSTDGIATPINIVVANVMHYGVAHLWHTVREPSSYPVTAKLQVSQSVIATSAKASGTSSIGRCTISATRIGN